MTNIKLIYNHITGTSRVFINGKSILKQTALDHFLQAPFHTWFRSLLDALYDEVMDSYTLEFVARPLECRLLQSQQGGCPHCVRLTFTQLPFDMTTPERLRQLAQLSPNLRPVQPTVTVYTDEENGELLEPQLNGAGQYPLCRVSCRLRSLRELEEGGMTPGEDGEIRFVYLFQTPFSAPFLQHLNQTGGRSYVFYANRSGMLGTVGDAVYCASIQPGDALTSYKSWLDYELLPAVLRQKLSEVTRSPETLDGLRLCALDQVDGRRFLIPRPWIAVGEHTRFESRGFPEQYPDDLEYESSNPEIIRVENGTLVGVRAGSCYIDVYELGYARPLYHLNVRCAEVVRSLAFSQDVIQLTCGDQIRVSLDVTPANAENRGEITFRSSDELVVSVDPRTGAVTANTSGEAAIYACVGEIRAGCTVRVRSRLEAIQIETSAVVLNENEEVRFTVKPYPSDAELGEYELSAEGDGVVQIRRSEGVVVGVSRGTVSLLARGEHGERGSTELTVKRPMNPNLFIGLGAVCASAVLLYFVFHLLFG